MGLLCWGRARSSDKFCLKSLTGSGILQIHVATKAQRHKASQSLGGKFNWCLRGYQSKGNKKGAPFGAPNPPNLTLST